MALVVVVAVVVELLVAAVDDNSLIDRALVVAVIGLGCWWELVDSIEMHLFQVLAFVALVEGVSWIH